MAGITGAVLTIPNALESDEGWYYMEYIALGIVNVLLFNSLDLYLMLTLTWSHAHEHFTSSLIDE